MVRVISLIGAIIITGVTGFLAFFYIQIISSGMAQSLFSNEQGLMTNEIINGIKNIGIMFVLISGLTCKKHHLSDGGIIFILIIIADFVLSIIGLKNYTVSIIILALYIFAAMIYLQGLFEFKRNCQLCVITGILLLLFSIGSMGIFFMYDSITNYLGLESVSGIKLIQTLIGSVFWILHAWVFSFSIKGNLEDEPDILSVDRGDAFESHINSSESKKKKKRKKKTANNDIDFTF